MNGDCEEKGEYKKRVKGGRGSVTSGGCVKGGGGAGGLPTSLPPHSLACVTTLKQTPQMKPISQSAAPRDSQLGDVWYRAGVGEGAGTSTNVTVLHFCLTQ